MMLVTTVLIDIGGDFGAPLCCWFISYSYSYSVRRGGRYSYSNLSRVAIRLIGLQVTANRLDQRSASPQFQQPSSTSTVSLSTRKSDADARTDDAFNHDALRDLHRPAVG